MLSNLSDSGEFDAGRAPFQDFMVMFRFRNDHAHDKVVDLSCNRASTYNHKFPDPISGKLDLGHATFAATTYWATVRVLHETLNIGMEEFHRHYNVSPWHSATHREALEALANEYRREVFAAA